MRDYLLDLIHYTHDLGVIPLVRIEGTAKSTEFKGFDQVSHMIFKGEFKTPNADMIGTFGVPNLGPLKSILTNPEYQENAKMTLTRRQSDQTPESLNFENASGDFKNSYRFMTAANVDALMKKVEAKVQISYAVEIEPSQQNIQRLKWQAEVAPSDSTIQITTEKNNLNIALGDPSSLSGNFIFHSNIKGTLKKPLRFQCKPVVSILNQTGNKKMRFSDQGALEITIESGLAVYQYILSAQSK